MAEGKGGVLMIFHGAGICLACKIQCSISSKRVIGCKDFKPKNGLAVIKWMRGTGQHGLIERANARALVKYYSERPKMIKQYTAALKWLRELLLLKKGTKK